MPTKAIMSLEIHVNPSIEVDELVDVLTELDAYQLRLHNDEYNTFDFVIDCLVSVCNHSAEQAEQCALLVHYKGSYVVNSGPKEDMETQMTRLSDLGLKASIELA